MKVIEIDSNSGERLFLRPLKTEYKGQQVLIRPTYFPNLNQEDNERMVVRHKARYGLVALFCRPHYTILDFPCGSGYGAELLKEYNIVYEGRDKDELSIQYANCLYANDNNTYTQDDLSNPQFLNNTYDVIGCIEGLEHIIKRDQEQLIKRCYEGLKKKGVLVISSPENKSHLSGPNPKNKFHLWELNKADFIALLSRYFEDVEIISTREKLHTGELQTTLYGICHKN